MLPPIVEALVAGIAADRMSGASELAMRALDAFALFCTDQRSAEELRELAANLEAAQPAMAAVRNVAHLCAELVPRSADAKTALQEIRRELVGAHEKVARNALKVITGRATVITLSRSTAVRTTLEALRSRERLAGVYVLESRPGREGRIAAGEFAAMGIPTKLIVDALGASLVRGCDLALVGADSVLRDGTLVNKIGSYGLALAANAAGKPFYCTCESLKFDPARSLETFASLAPRPGEELEPPPNVEAVNIYFDLTPAQLVTSYITEKGVFEPKGISQVLMR